MRARFSAYAVHNEVYLLASWHGATRPAHVEFDPALRWVRLDVLGTEEGGLLDVAGIVEFAAHYEEAGHEGTLHEVSRFVREDGQWFYVGAEDARLT
jgi:SEC-C motif-containing protein